MLVTYGKHFKEKKCNRKPDIQNWAYVCYRDASYKNVLLELIILYILNFWPSYRLPLMGKNIVYFISSLELYGSDFSVIRKWIKQKLLRKYKKKNEGFG